MNKLFGLFLLALAPKRIKNAIAWSVAFALTFQPMLANAAARFWVGGAGTWDASTTTNWSATSGGAGGQSVPGAADDVTINAASGTGTITVNTNFAINSLNTSAMTSMTLDFGTNNNSPTISSGSGSQWNNNGSTTRTINLGSGTFTLSGTNANGGIDWSTTTGLTLGANTATFLFSGTTTSGRSVDFGGSALSNLPSLSFAANSSRGSWTVLGSTMTIPTVTIAAPNFIAWTSNSITLTNLVLSGGSVSSPIELTTNQNDTQRTIPLTNSTSGAGLMVRGINPTTGTITGTNSIDLGRNGANVILTPPSGSGCGGRIIGG